ncbi:MAG: metallophosphoesterase family protein, partial [Deltaproteobacteria bacterium]
MLEHTRRLALGADGSLRLAVVADTHSTPHAAVMGHLAALRPDAILLAGDIGALSVCADLARIAPLYAVRGNIDARSPELPDALVLEIADGEQPVTLRLLLVHIAVNGLTVRPDAARRARACGASVVVCGHSHVPFLTRDRGLTLFNPGSIGPRRFRLPIVFGTLTVERAGVRFAHFDAETG